MIVVGYPLYRGLRQRVNSGGWRRCLTASDGVGGGVKAGGAQDAGDGIRGAGGDGREQRDLVHVVLVEGRPVDP
jgi:hypothetical protein